MSSCNIWRLYVVIKSGWNVFVVSTPHRVSKGRQTKWSWIPDFCVLRRILLDQRSLPNGYGVILSIWYPWEEGGMGSKGRSVTLTPMECRVEYVGLHFYPTRLHAVLKDGRHAPWYQSSWKCVQRSSSRMWTSGRGETSGLILQYSKSVGSLFYPTAVVCHVLSARLSY